jgi:hypothetical protein
LTLVIFNVKLIVLTLEDLMGLEPKAPYAPAATVITAITHFRDKGFPAVIDTEILVRIGVPESTRTWILGALKFLGLVTEDGQPTVEFDSLRKANQESYSAVLADILRNSYSHVFEVVPDPSNSTRNSIDNAFKVYQPQAQRTRMVALFLGLCAEAKLITVTSDAPKRRSNGSKTERPSKSNGAARNPAKSVLMTPSVVIESSMTHQPQPVLSTNYDLVMAFIRQLPGGRKWTKSQRDRWLNALSASIDIEIEVINEESVNATS